MCLGTPAISGCAATPDATTATATDPAHWRAAVVIGSAGLTGRTPEGGHYAVLAECTGSGSMFSLQLRRFPIDDRQTGTVQCPTRAIALDVDTTADQDFDMRVTIQDKALQGSVQLLPKASA